ncbi:MAG TPA: hypothetical protein VGR73_18155 [Bryobacteraceae bacterium]|nr:hypothetical protein [Bryobacteraceae bacterium]
MRRLVAAALLAWANFTLILAAITPVFASSAGSNLPLCCLRDGKHRCTLLAPAPGSGPALRSARCAVYPGVRALPAQARASGVAVSGAVFAAIASHPAPHPRTETLFRISYNRAGQKRGPPVSL